MSIFIKNIFGFYHRHLKITMLPFQAVLDDFDLLEGVRNRKYRIHYAFPFVFTLCIVLDTLIMYQEYGNDPYHPVFYNHLFMHHMPVFFLKQGSISFACVYGLILLCNGCLMLDSYKHINYILYHSRKSSIYQLPYLSSSFVKPELGAKIVKRFDSLNRLVRQTVRFLIIQINVAFTIPQVSLQLYKVYSTNFRYIPSFRLIVVTFTCPILFRSLVSIIQIGLQFIVQNAIIQVKQKHYNSSMNVISSMIHFKAVNKVYMRTLKMMEQLLEHTHEVKAFDRFYRKYITVIIVLFGLSGCSVLNAIIRSGGEAPIFQAIPWMVYSFVYFAFILFFSSSSSRTIYLNLQLFMSLRRLQFRLLSTSGLYRSQVVKLDLVNEYKLLLSKCSFRLLNSAPINNKLFAFQIFGYISIFYMKLVSDG